MTSNLFYRLFPPPVFLRMPSVGLDISDQSIRFVELSETRNGFVVKKFGERLMESGIIEEGEIKNPDAVKKELTALHEEFNIEFANVSLPEQQAYLLKLNLPKIKQTEIRGSLELQLQEFVPITAGEAIFDYDFIGKVAGDGDFTEIGLAALPRAVSESYADVFSGTGITPLAFEVEAQAIARAAIPKSDKRAFMVMDFGKTRTGISIVSGGVPIFTSTVNVGGAALTKAIEKQFGVDAVEAERIKREEGFVKGNNTQGMLLTLMSTISILRDEINKHYVYWHTHLDQYGNKRPKIEKVLLCGGDSNLAGFTDYLSSGLKAEVELANTMVNVNTFNRYIPEIEFSDSLSYATAIGLALKSFS